MIVTVEYVVPAAEVYLHMHPAVRVVETGLLDPQNTK